MAHLLPRFGHKRLDELGDEDIQGLKTALADKSSKTVNNMLTTLNTLLGVAVEWGVLERMPARIKLLKVTAREAAFYDFDEYDRLVEAAAGVHLQVLLGGDAGLRPGEFRTLHWTSVDFGRRRLTIERHEYKGQFTLPKHDKIRRVPMTDALADALRGYRHLRGPLVLYRSNGGVLTPRAQRHRLGKALRLAGLPAHGPHALRHYAECQVMPSGSPKRA